MSFQAHLLRTTYFLIIGYGIGGAVWYVGRGGYSWRFASAAALFLLAWDLIVMRPRCQEG